MGKYEDICKQYGTPCYVYDIDELHQRVSYLQEKLGPDYDLVYAVKANSFIAKKLESQVSRFEICSPGEFDICDALGISHQKMVISGVHKEESSIRRMMESGDILKYTIESISQYELLLSCAKECQTPISVLIRVTSGNQFGVSEEDLFDILKRNDSKWITIDGIEYFSGTQKHSLSRIQKEITYLKTLIDKIEEQFSFSISEIEYGPGLPVFYYQGEEFDEDAFLEELRNILKDLAPKKVTLEIGRSIAASCGSYLTRVVDCKKNQYGNYAIVDGGIHHLVYYGQTMAMKIPHYQVFPKKEELEDTYQICGSLCTINDFLVKNITTRKLQIGDLFVFQKVGAYSSTEGISLFLSRDLPKIILWEQGKSTLVRDSIKTSQLNFPNEK